MVKNKFWFWSLLVWFMMGIAFHWTMGIRVIVILNSLFVLYNSISGLWTGGKYE